MGTGKGTTRRDSLVRAAVLAVAIALATPTPAFVQVLERARRHRLWARQHVRRGDRHADARASGPEPLRYNQFHAAAVCQAMRTAAQTPCNYHTDDAGVIIGGRHCVPRQHRCPPAERRAADRDARMNGYNTAAFGKCHAASGPGGRDRSQVQNGATVMAGSGASMRSCGPGS
jgi:arylsulfatase A-like enzyme